MGDQKPPKDLSKLKNETKEQINRLAKDFDKTLVMFKEAVDLASQQVSDQRILLIEKKLGKSSSYQLSDFFMDLLIATVASPLVSLALSTVTKIFIERVLNTREMFLKMGKDGIYQIVGADQLMFGKFENRPSIVVTDILKPGSKNYGLWRITESMIEPTSDALRTAAREIIKESEKPQTTSNTSANVLFKNAIFTFVDKQGSTNERIWNKQKDDIDNDKYPEDKLEGLLKDYKSKLQIAPGPEVREKRRMQYSKNFEALIWVLLFGGYKNMVEVRPVTEYGKALYAAYGGAKEVPSHLPDIILWRVDPELVVYWVNNLIHPLGDGDETFREKVINDGYRSMGLSPHGKPRFTPDYENELESVKHNYASDPAQLALKEYFKQLSKNTEIILADPQKILNKVR